MVHHPDIRGNLVQVPWCGIWYLLAQRNLFLIFCSLPKHLRFASCLNQRRPPLHAIPSK